MQYPGLMVEVRSTSPKAGDRGQKLIDYRRFETLQEYVLIQPEQPIVEVFARNEAGKWVLSMVWRIPSILSQSVARSRICMSA